jgi:pimeloyl-ACP methyl ester carboxylesterase
MKKSLKILSILIGILIVGFGTFWYSRPLDVDFESARAEIPHAENSRFADLDGLRVHYQEKGSGSPLILIHGYTSLTYTWKDIFEPLSKEYRVIAIDLKGFGFTAKPDGDYTRRAQGDLVIKLLEYLKIDRAVLCGNSMGGEVALNAAVRHPQRVSALVLIDSGGVSVSGGGSVSPRYLQTPLLGPAITALALTSDSLVRGGLEKSFYDRSKVTAERVAAYYRPLKSRGGQQAAILTRLQAGLDPVEPELPKLHVPTLILWGAEDVLIPLEAGRKLNSLIKGSRLVILEQTGHVPQEESPERVTREIEIFLTTLPQPADQITITK